MNEKTRVLVQVQCMGRDVLRSQYNHETYSSSHEKNSSMTDSFESANTYITPLTLSGANTITCLEICFFEIEALQTFPRVCRSSRR